MQPVMVFLNLDFRDNLIVCKKLKWKTKTWILLIRKEKTNFGIPEVGQEFSVRM